MPITRPWSHRTHAHLHCPRFVGHLSAHCVPAFRALLRCPYPFPTFSYAPTFQPPASVHCLQLSLPAEDALAPSLTRPLSSRAPLSWPCSAMSHRPARAQQPPRPPISRFCHSTVALACKGECNMHWLQGIYDMLRGGLNQRWLPSPCAVSVGRFAHASKHVHKDLTGHTAGRWYPAAVEEHRSMVLSVCGVHSLACRAFHQTEVTAAGSDALHVHATQACALPWDLIAVFRCWGTVAELRSARSLPCPRTARSTQRNAPLGG